MASASAAHIPNNNTVPTTTVSTLHDNRTSTLPIQCNTRDRSLQLGRHLEASIVVAGATGEIASPTTTTTIATTTIHRVQTAATPNARIHPNCRMESGEIKSASFLRDPTRRQTGRRQPHNDPRRTVKHTC